MLECNNNVDYNVDMKNSSTTVRISDTDHKLLKKMAREEKSSLAEVLEKAISGYDKQRWLAQLNESLAKLKQDDRAWREYKDEQSLWDEALKDGLEAKRKRPKAKLI